MDVDVEILPAMPEVTDALAPDAPRIWDEIPDNIAFSWADGDEAAVDAAFDRAAHVSKVWLFDNRLAPVSMEPRGGIGEWDESLGRYTLTAPTQGVSAISRIFADHAFARHGGTTYSAPEAEKALALSVDFFRRHLD